MTAIIVVPDDDHVTFISSHPDGHTFRTVTNKHKPQDIAVPKIIKDVKVLSSSRIEYNVVSTPQTQNQRRRVFYGASRYLSQNSDIGAALQGSERLSRLSEQVPI